jgi:hypothetical protein
VRFPQRTAIAVLAAGAIGFGVLGIARPARLARLVGTDEASARALGMRDLTNGVLLLLARDKRPVLAARALADLDDAWKFGPNDPRVLAGTLGFAALAFVAYARA